MFFLSAPYSHQNPAVMHARFQVMQEATAILALEGVNIYSPIVHWHETARQYDLPTDAHWWKKMNFDALNRCDGMYLLTMPGWEISEGVQMELGWAKEKPHFMKNYMIPTNLKSYIDRRGTLEV